MNRLNKMDTDDLSLKIYELNNKMRNLAVNYIGDDGWMILADYNELMTSLKITIDVIQAELDSRYAVERYTL